MTLEPYQTTAVKASLVHLSFNQGGVLVAPAGSGKTWICAALISQGGWSRVLWVAPTQETRDQGQAACKLFGVQAEVVCFQSAPSGAGRDLIIIDEAHGAACETIRAIMADVDLDCRVLGVTATPERPDGEDIGKIIGPTFHAVERAAVMATGRIVSAKVRWLETPGNITEQVRAMAEKEIRGWMSEEQVNRIIYRHALKLGIVRNEGRNREAAKVARRAIDAGRSVLVLVAEKEQGEAIAGLVGEGCVFAYSGMAKRAATIEAVRAGEIRCVIATSLADQGLDLAILSVLVMACGGRAAGRAEQRIGRIMRAFENKGEAWCFDFRDGHHPMLRAQGFARGKVYKSLGCVVG